MKDNKLELFFWRYNIDTSTKTFYNNHGANPGTDFFLTYKLGTFNIQI